MLLHDFSHNMPGGFGMLFKKLFGGFPALTDALTPERVPGTALFHDAGFAAEIDDFPIPGNSRAVKNIELRFFKRRSHFVFYNLDPRSSADNIVSLLQRSNTANIHAHGGVELERVAAGGGLRVAKHDADLHANLIDEDDHGLRTGNRTSKFAQSLRHQPGLQSHV